VQNGIAMSTFHHTAYESNLMGIDPDGKIILNEQVRGTRDGPMFSHGLLDLDGKRMRFPTADVHRPNRDFLAQKFDEFRKAP
jgi:putative restriction endonuclease